MVAQLLTMLRRFRLPRPDQMVGSAACSCVREAAVICRHLLPGRSTGRCGGQSTRRPESAKIARGFRRAFVSILFALSLPVVAAAATPPGTTISNSAQLAYALSAVPQPPLLSNQVDLLVRGPATIEFLRYDPASPLTEPVLTTEYRTGGGFFIPIPASVELATQPVSLTATANYAAGQILYLRLTDLDQNLLPGVAETVLVTVTCATTGDSEVLRLTETGLNTGAFTGYLPTTVVGLPACNGELLVTGSCQLTTSYTDVADVNDIANTTAQIAPLTGLLWVQKTTTLTVAGIGDHVPYVITVTNTDTARTANGVSVVDRLPRGFRYQAGTTRVNGLTAPDPMISADGRGLIFTLGDLASSASVEIAYVVAIGVGAKPGVAVNQANASDQVGHFSNTATARIKIMEELLRSRAYLVGRVLIGDCSADPEIAKGLAGARIYLEDGTFVTTDSDGLYHFEGLNPGSHVVQLDLDTVPAVYDALACDDNTRFAGRAYSQFIDLQGGTLWRADFNVGLKPLPIGEATLALNAKVEGTTALFTLPLGVGGVPLKNLRLTIVLPDGVTYQTGSSQLDGGVLDDPLTAGTALTYRLGDRPEGWNGNLTLRGEITAKQSVDLPVKALLTFDSPQKVNQRTPVADTLLFVTRTETGEKVPDFVLHPHFPTFSAKLTAEDKLVLDQVIEKIRPFRAQNLRAVGHTDNVRIAARSRNVYADNFALSKARAISVARYIGDALGIPPERLIAEGKADTEPITVNWFEAGRAQNRRVELFLSGEKLIYNFEYGVKKGESGEQRVETQGKRPGEEETAAAALPIAAPAMDKAPILDAQWLASAAAETRIVWPVPGFVPAIPSTEIMIQYNRGEQLSLLLNGEPVDPLNFDKTTLIPGSEMVVASWAGVDLREGLNQLEATLTDGDGRVVATLTREVWFVSMATQVTLLEAQSALVADGVRSPVIAVRLTDRDGHPVHPQQQFSYTVAPPYAALRDLEQSTATNGRLVTGADGVALLQLEPTTSTGEVQIAIPLGDRSEEVRVWLKPALRDWILVGIAEGTAGFNTLSGNLQALDENDVDEDLYQEGRLAFFAKGKVKGDWLLTMAYDSDKRKRDSLHQTIDPDAYYTLYGDGTNQQYEAASARKLYVKLERDQFYALFGDYDTGLTVTELARYSRSLNGVKSEYQGNLLSYKAFASDTNQAFVRDEIPGDGTSGLYRLSRRAIVINSEKITIETRDRFHSEVVVESHTLSRHLDYDIDYDDGTLFFKAPIPSRDSNFNPITIIVDYESMDGRDTAYTFGGRAALKPLGERLEVGASLVHEGTRGAEGDLSAVDATLKLGAATTLRAEVANSRTTDAGVTTDGNAWLAEVAHRDQVLDGRVYLREQQSGFGLGQQSSTETGTRKFGGDARYRLAEHWTIGGELSRLEKLDTGAEQDLGSAEVTYRQSTFSLMTGMRQATDRLPGEVNRSTLGLFGATWNATKRATLRLTHEQALLDNNASANYPTRTLLGLDYRLTEAVSAFVEQEYTDGLREESSMTRAGLKAAPWEGAQLQSTITQQGTEYGPRVFATTGLMQTWKINEIWSVDAGIDRSQTLRDPGNTPVNGDAPPASGSSVDFTALSTGVNRKAESWTWSNRLEYRISDREDKLGLYTGAEGEVRRGLALSGRFQYFDTQRDDGSAAVSGALRLGLAYRPLQTHWIILDRLDYRFDRDSATTADYRNWRLINNLNANYRPNSRAQLALQYGAKYVQEQISGSNYSDYIDLSGVEGRFDVTCRWDIGLRASVLHAWNLNQYDYSAGPSVGYRVMKNAWLSVGYNVAGFVDQDFSAADYTAQGPYVKFRVKFDQNSVREALALF